jgi:hypothetical protein
MVTENNTTKAPKMSVNETIFLIFSKQHKKKKQNKYPRASPRTEIFVYGLTTTKAPKMSVNDKKIPKEIHNAYNKTQKGRNCCPRGRNVANAEERKTCLEGMKNRPRERRKETATLIPDVLSKEPFQLDSTK